MGLRHVPRVPGVGRAARHRLELRRLHRAHRAAAVRARRRCLRAGVDTRRGHADPSGAARGDARRRRRVRHQLRDHPPRRRRQAGAEPVLRPHRVRGDSRRDARGRPGCRVDRAGPAVRHRRHVRAAAEDRRSVHLRRALDVADGPAPSERGKEPPGMGARRAGVAAGHAPAARVRADAGRAVHVQHEFELRRVDGQGLDERRRAYADPKWRAKAMGKWAGNGRLHRAALGDVRDRYQPCPSRARRAHGQRARASAA